MKKPKILLFDIETLPVVTSHVQQLPEYNSDRYGLTLKADVNSMLCFGYKELGDSKAKCLNVWDTELGAKDINNDLELLIWAREILETADAIVTHNGTNFDLKFLNTRLVMAGLAPLHKIPHIDTCSVAKSKLFMTKNRLDHLADKLSTSRKMENGGWSLWSRLAFSSYKGPQAPSPEQTAKDKKIMSKYCAQDVEVLEKIFLKLRPFVNTLPNYNYFLEKRVCKSCGSTKLHKHSIRVTKTGKQQRYQCQSCGTMNTEDKKGRLY